MNNNGFILYDALLSFILLSSMIILFSQLTSINIENKNIANDKFIKLMIIRNAIYNNYEVVKYDDYTTYASKDNYCVSNEDNEYEDLCIEM